MRFFGYKHWTLETQSRCFYIGKGRKCRPRQITSRNHKWHAIVKRFGLRIEVCVGPMTNEEACAWEIKNIIKEETYTTNHSHDDSNDIKCNFTKGGDVGGTGSHRSDEQRKRMSLAQKGKKRTKATRQRLSESHKGQIISEETRAKLRMHFKGKKQDPIVAKTRTSLLAKKYRFISSENELVIIFNMKTFCEKNGLSRSKMSLVATGKRLQYNGWHLATS